LLSAAEPSLRAVLSLTFTVGSIAVFRFSGRESYAGYLTAATFAAAAVAAVVAGRAMDRLGRRPGLAAGHGTLVVAAGVAAVAVSARSAPVLLIAAALFGAGQGAANLGRGAMADMYEPERRGRAVGILLAVGTIGAVGGPILAAGTQAFARNVLGVEPLLFPWAVVAALALLGLTAVLNLRPDPRDLAVAAPRAVALVPRRRAADLLRSPPLRAAVVAIGVAQASMVAVMGVTPVVIDEHGGGDLAVATTISFHVAGMFAFSPLIGAALDRWGRKPGLVAGALVSAGGAILASVTDNTTVIATGVFLVGLGWSGAFLASTTMISDLTTAEERAGALGFTDLLASLAAVAGALAAGFLLEGVGFWVVGVSMAALLVPVLALVLPLRESSPGRWGTGAAAAA